MNDFVIPDDLSDQTERLVRGGVAEKALNYVSQSDARLNDITVEQCQFWVRRGEFDEIRGSQLQIVISYPSPDEDNPHPSYGYAVTVSLDGSLWDFAECLEPDQMALVERLAEPSSE